MTQEHEPQDTQESAESGASEPTEATSAGPMSPPVVAQAAPSVDPRRRLRELLSVPERDRSDEQWDEINELEIQLAPGNRVHPGSTPGPVGLPPGGGGRHFQQKKHPPKGDNKGGGGGGNKRRPRPANKPPQG